MNQDDLLKMVSSIANRIYVATKQYLESRMNGHVEQVKIVQQWKELQAEREKEKKVIYSLIKHLRKSTAMADLPSKIDKLFDYMTQ